MNRTSYPKVSNNDGAKQLACGIILEAVKQYYEADTSAQMKGKILKDLRNNQLINALTDDLGIITAERLVLHSNDIAKRLGVIKEEEGELVC